MKKIILMLSFVPVMALAFVNSEETPGTPISDDEMSDVAPGHGATICALQSDMYCFGKRPGSVCVTEPPPPAGRSGVCQTRGTANQDNQISCLCR